MLINQKKLNSFYDIVEQLFLLINNLFNNMIKTEKVMGD